MAIDPLDHSVTEALRTWRVQHNAGISVSDALDGCATICADPAGRSCFQQAAVRASSGDGIGGMMDCLKPALCESERAVIVAGWQSGRVEAVLDSVVAQRELWYAARQKIRAKMALPVIVLLIASFVAPLPAFIGGNSGVGGYIASALLPLAVAYALWRLLERTLAARNPANDRLLLKLPIVSGVEINRSLSEFASTLSVLLGAGISISNALEICARSASNSIYREGIKGFAERVTKGGVPLSSVMRSGPLWPQQIIHMIEVGEKSGNLDAMLGRIASACRDDYTRAIEELAAWLPRLLYALVAGFIILQILRMVIMVSGFYQ
ncbi:MAG TPA: type II secretion system F family protein [Planctomycetota bacterium]|nr:type II secretion system F family protein [Planctomycetota bacterium]